MNLALFRTIFYFHLPSVSSCPSFWRPALFEADDDNADADADADDHNHDRNEFNVAS